MADKQEPAGIVDEDLDLSPEAEQGAANSLVEDQDALDAAEEEVRNSHEPATPELQALADGKSRADLEEEERLAEEARRKKRKAEEEQALKSVQEAEEEKDLEDVVAAASETSPEGDALDDVPQAADVEATEVGIVDDDLSPDAEPDPEDDAEDTADNDKGGSSPSAGDDAVFVIPPLADKWRKTYEKFSVKLTKFEASQHKDLFKQIKQKEGDYTHLHELKTSLMQPIEYTRLWGSGFEVTLLDIDPVTQEKVAGETTHKLRITRNGITARLSKGDAVTPREAAFMVAAAQANPAIRAPRAKGTDLDKAVLILIAREKGYTLKNDGIYEDLPKAVREKAEAQVQAYLQNEKDGTVFYPSLRNSPEKAQALNALKSLDKPIGLMAADLTDADNEKAAQIQADLVALSEKEGNLSQPLPRFNDDLDLKALTPEKIKELKAEAGVTSEDVARARALVDSGQGVPDGVPKFGQVMEKAGLIPVDIKNELLTSQAAARALLAVEAIQKGNAQDQSRKAGFIRSFPDDPQTLQDAQAISKEALELETLKANDDEQAISAKRLEELKSEALAILQGSQERFAAQAQPKAVKLLGAALKGYGIEGVAAPQAEAQETAQDEAEQAPADTDITADADSYTNEEIGDKVHRLLGEYDQLRTPEKEEELKAAIEKLRPVNEEDALQAEHILNRIKEINSEPENEPEETAPASETESAKKDAYQATSDALTAYQNEPTKDSEMAVRKALVTLKNQDPEEAKKIKNLLGATSAKGQAALARKQAQLAQLAQGDDASGQGQGVDEAPASDAEAVTTPQESAEEAPVTEASSDPADSKPQSEETAPKKPKRKRSKPGESPHARKLSKAISGTLAKAANPEKGKGASQDSAIQRLINGGLKGTFNEATQLIDRYLKCQEAIGENKQEAEKIITRLDEIRESMRGNDTELAGEFNVALRRAQNGNDTSNLKKLQEKIIAAQKARESAPKAQA